MAFHVIFCVVSCVLQLNIIQANEIPILAIKDVQSTKSSYVTFLLKHQVNATIMWFSPHHEGSNIERTAKGAVSAEYTSETSPIPVDLVGVFSAERSTYMPQGKIYFKTKPDERDLGSFSLISASPRYALLRQGEEFEMAMVAERQTAQRAHIDRGIYVIGWRNWNNFSPSILLEVGSNVKRRFNDQVRCTFSVKEKPSNAVRAEVKCFIRGIPIGDTDNYHLELFIYGGYYDIEAEIEGDF
ncbi:hypothetical protein CAPTEDRAFT_196159 [Capitella teleta]|uniref:Uncharacterized protein n=1 Tax=Capitella teleta TaxID=283909 RepID=R7U0E4_CAPTE|nr:hypothetical protein CAPTEDRAFT_196159 [Capitella teleta]|eukprot:ELT99469.1 hypothetical protein CAPTEDRAFT_196159 [Capitella teleta]